MSFRSYSLRKPWLDKYLKSHASEDPSKSNKVNGLKHCSNLNHSTFAYLLINVKAIEIELEKVSLINILNLQTVCEHFYCRSQTFYS